MDLNTVEWREDLMQPTQHIWDKIFLSFVADDYKSDNFFFEPSDVKA